jgi:hypothetical protein
LQLQLNRNWQILFVFLVMPLQVLSGDLFVLVSDEATPYPLLNFMIFLPPLNRVLLLALSVITHGPRSCALCTALISSRRIPAASAWALALGPSPEP